MIWLKLWKPYKATLLWPALCAIQKQVTLEQNVSAGVAHWTCLVLIHSWQPSRSVRKRWMRDGTSEKPRDLCYRRFNIKWKHDALWTNCNKILRNIFLHITKYIMLYLEAQDTSECVWSVPFRGTAKQNVISIST